EDGVEIVLVEGSEDGLGGRGRGQVVTLVAEEHTEGDEDVGLVVGDEDAGGVGLGAGHMCWCECCAARSGKMIGRRESGNVKPGAEEGGEPPRVYRRLS